MRRCLDRRKERSRSPPFSRDLREGVLPACGNTKPSTMGTAVHQPELHVLYASPLDQRIPQINIQGELDMLEESLQKAKCHMSIKVGTATTKTFAQLLTRARSTGGIILHLSVHVVTAENGVGLVFENGFGGAHILYRPQLEELLGGSQQLDGLSFVFINGCSSESIAELLVEAGCHLVIATRGKVYDAAATVFTQQFYYALGSHVSVRSAFESAQQVLRVDPDPKVKASADMFVLFGQRAARSQMLPRPANVGSGTDGQVSLPIESHSLGNPDGNCLPPRVEDYVDRSSVLSEILRNFDSSGGQRPRRACVLSGPEGIGKTVAAIELAHFASSPGRLFSRNVLYVPIDGTPDIANVVQGISQSLATRRPPVLSSASRNQKDILQALHHLDHTRGRHLLLLDDRCGAVGASSEVRSLLSNMLEAAKNLSLVVCSREQMYESLGPCKCVNVPMVALTAVQSAQLFLKRMHRPLRPCDFEQNASAQIALARSEEILTRLAQHPLLVQLAGNPGQVDAICQRVTPQLRSLFDLCGVRAARATSLDETIASHVSVLVPQQKTIEPLQLERKMSIDGAVGELLPKAMSMDGPALARAMSIDETQATDNGIDHF